MQLFSFLQATNVAEAGMGFGCSRHRTADNLHPRSDERLCRYSADPRERAPDHWRMRVQQPIEGFHDPEQRPRASN